MYGVQRFIPTFYVAELDSLPCTIIIIRTTDGGTCRDHRVRGVTFASRFVRCARTIETLLG